MKHAILLLAGAAVLLSASCNKSYHCECIDSGRNSLEYFDIKATKNSDAESKCAEHNGDPAAGGLTNCHLK